MKFYQILPKDLSHKFCIKKISEKERFYNLYNRIMYLRNTFRK